MKKIFLFLLILVSNCFSQFIPHFQHQPPVGYQINLAHPDAQGLVGRWLVHEGLGLTLYDLSPFGLDGVLTNMDAATDWVVGRDGYALDFDGSDDFVDIPDSDIWHGSTFTWACWLNFTSTANNQAWLMKGTFSTNWSFGFQTSGAQGARLFIASTTGDGGSNWQEYNNLFVTGRWYYVVIVFNGNLAAGDRLKFFVDGLEQTLDASAGTIDPTIENSTNPLAIGRFPTLGRHFTGLISDLLILNIPLPAKEIMSRFIYSYAMFEQPPGRILAVAAAAAAVDRQRLIITNP